VRAADALDRVGRILPRVANRVSERGTEEVLVTQLAPGDRVRVRPGEIVPTDGHLVEGASSFDEALLTGEPLPVTRGPGAQVIGGSCNVDQPVVVEVARTSDDSAVAEIHRLLARGLREAPRYAILAQRAANWFVGGVLIVAIVTAAAWLWIDPASALPNTIAVLIVTCPCALALATPVAIAIGVGRFADAGLLTVRSDALEILARSDTFAFDKTGTLTTGELSISEVVVDGRFDEPAVRAIAAALERDSEHPLARAFRPDDADAVAALPVVEARENRVGEGLSGRIDGGEWRLGRPDFALSQAQRAIWQPRIDGLIEQGHLVIALGNRDGDAALFALSDRLRAGIPDLLARLRADGVRHLALISGDTGASVRRFARGLGFDEALGDLKPADKLQWIRARQAEGHRVTMVGDGINDAPTLGAADVSVSFAHATELAQVNSGLLILGHELTPIATMRTLAERTRRVIRQNLTWAASYNFLAVPFAALGFIAPWGAAIGMSLSSLLVVVNALRLRRD
jgi:Cu2+-exporting ATPase